MLMMTLDDIIKEVAVKNGHGLERDDPLLFLVTVMDCIARSYDEHNAALVVQYAELLNQYRQTHQEAAHDWRKDAKEYANAVLNAGLAASREAGAKMLADGAAKSVGMVKEELAREMAAHLAAERKEFQELRRFLTLVLKIMGGVLVGLLGGALLIVFS